jgi:hypothetical protein
MPMALMLYKWLLLFGYSFLGQAVSENPAPAPVSPGSAHPFYLSVTEINQNASAKTLEISCKMFAEDLEAILEKDYKTTLDITTEKDKSSFDKFIPDYINRHLAITIDGKLSKLNYIGFENEKESAYVYLEIENISSAKKIDVVNSILHDFIDQQVNIIHVTINGKRQSTRLVYPASQASFTY